LRLADGHDKGNIQTKYLGNGVNRMASRYIVRYLVFESGGRFPSLSDSATGIPLPDSTPFVVIELRAPFGRGRSGAEGDGVGKPSEDE
jgi:hypothetical protein